MIFWISKQIASLFGLDITKVQKAVILAVMILVVIAVIALGLFLRSCFHKEPKLDEKQIQKAQQAIAANDRQAMVEVLIAAEVAEKKIDANVVDASTQTVNAIAAAKKKANEMSNEELANYLNERSKE